PPESPCSSFFRCENQNATTCRVPMAALHPKFDSMHLGAADRMGQIRREPLLDHPGGQRRAATPVSDRRHGRIRRGWMAVSTSLIQRHRRSLHGARRCRPRGVRRREAVRRNGTQPQAACRSRRAYPVMSRPARPYNTALASSIPAVRAELTDTKFAFSDRGVVFAHDILEPLPEVMDRLIGSRVECLYAETPWVAGSATFYERAGLAPKPHAEYVSAVERLIEHFGKPAFIVCSKRDAAALGEAVSPIVLNGERAWLARAGGGTI